MLRSPCNANAQACSFRYASAAQSPVLVTCTPPLSSSGPVCVPHTFPQFPSTSSQDLTTGQRVFLDPRFNLSSFGALPSDFASSVAVTAGTMVHGTAIGPARGSQQVQSELEATATSGGHEEQQRAGQVATATAIADGSGEGSGEGPSGSGGAEHALAAAAQHGIAATICRPGHLAVHAKAVCFASSATYVSHTA